MKTLTLILLSFSLYSQTFTSEQLRNILLMNEKLNYQLRLDSLQKLSISELQNKIIIKDKQLYNYRRTENINKEMIQNYATELKDCKKLNNVYKWALVGCGIITGILIIKNDQP